MKQPIYIHKFGGTSIADSDRIRNAVRLTLDTQSTGRKVVVVSALGGVTDQLLRAVDCAERRDVSYHSEVEQIARRHEQVLQEVALPGEQSFIREGLEKLWHNLGELLDGIFLLRECTLRTRDALTGMGERASAPLVAAAFRQAGASSTALDATDFIRTDDLFGSANVDFKSTHELVASVFSKIDKNDVAIVTGFIGSTPEGVTTTLGRSGSDYTATILAWALDAEEVTIWTDVDGVLTADPRLVPEAFSLSTLSYQEASEMAYFGAKVLHPRTMRPLLEKNIPLITRNTLNADDPGTRISSETNLLPGNVKAVTAIRNMALVTIEGSGMLGVPGVAARACKSLADAGINILMITQASSEQNLCFVVMQGDRNRAVLHLRHEFERELERKDITNVDARAPVAVTAVVGENMRHHPGIAGKMLSALGRSHVNVLAIAQGSSERNISVVVDEADSSLAVRALHETFAMNRRQVNLVLAGTGTVGSVLLGMLDKQSREWATSFNLNVKLVGVIRSRTGILDAGGIPFDRAIALASDGPEVNIEKLPDYIETARLENTIFIDATASDEVSATYDTLLQRGISVVTANKRGNASSLSYYRRLRASQRPYRVAYRYETTVGAGLPVIATIQDLIRSGDRVHRIEGVLSGTLAFVFNSMGEGATFSEALVRARALGFTEPDPREDLSGEDVVRKMMILAREAGVEVEREEVHVQSLVDDEAASLSTEQFMSDLARNDAYWSQRMEKLAAENRKLQFVGLLENGTVRVGLEEIGPGSPLFTLSGTDNLVALTTDRYAPSPLVIRGPGAGPQVTAAGMVADVLKVAEYVI